MRVEGAITRSGAFVLKFASTYERSEFMQTISPPERTVLIGRSGKADRSVKLSPPRKTPKAPHPKWMGVV
jgi:hypothetical protein